VQFGEASKHGAPPLPNGVNTWTHR